MRPQRVRGRSDEPVSQDVAAIAEAVKLARGFVRRKLAALGGAASDAETVELTDRAASLVEAAQREALRKLGASETCRSGSTFLMELGRIRAVTAQPNGKRCPKCLYRE